ncbi:MAG: AtpZ/AtpI family protein [Planctomycetes bacterium]|nr:AtpZ/AtpI family protein [Planctomycetota bacterium]
MSKDEPAEPSGKSDSSSDAPSQEEYRKLAESARGLREHSSRTEDAEKRFGNNAAANSWLKYTSVGLQFVLVLLLPLGLGYWADTYFGTLPWLTLVGFALGAVASMTSIILEVQRMDRVDDKSAGKDK